MTKNLYIIAGCNGAGKTTASYTILPEILDCHEFERIKELLSRDESFAIETTLATRSYVNLVHQAHAKGYRVTLVFFWLRTPELALQRIAERVKAGGHDIPSPTARRRYVAGIDNLFNLYAPEVDCWYIYDNSVNPRIKIAEGGNEASAKVTNPELFTQMKSYVK